MSFSIADAMDLHKALTPLVCLLVIQAYDSWDNYAALLYASMHSIYCLMQLMKTLLDFPDQRYIERNTSIFQFAWTFIKISGHWIPIFLICSNDTYLPPHGVALAVSVFALGIFWHFLADMHKTVFMEHRQALLNLNGEMKTEDEIITKVIPPFLDKKMYAYSRNPNFFGKLMVHLALALCSKSIIPLIVLLTVLYVNWIPIMQRRDANLTHREHYDVYMASTPLLVPYTMLYKRQ